MSDPNSKQKDILQKNMEQKKAIGGYYLTLFDYVLFFDI